MVEVFISIAAKIAEYTVAPVGRWLCYSFHYNSNIQNLKNQIQDLQHAKNRVQHSVDDAFIGHEIEGDVKAWLEKVDRIIILATGKLGESEEEAGTRSSIATCLNLKKRHQLSRDAKKLEKNIAELLKNGKFDKVTYLAALDEMVTTGDVDYMAMDSRMTTFKAIMEALGSVAINKIGVWGMPGVGKSTLMREIARQAREDKLFNKVVMVIVTESPDVKRIQEEIVDMLGQKFDQETAEKGKASLLRQELSKGKKILVILDDIWKELDLQQIGIPSEGCKLVMTSRNKDVLISGMGAQIDIELKILQEEEAWNLFKKMAGGDSLIKGEVERIATEVAKECAGLPIALVTVSKALKNKSLAEWKDSLRRLKSPAPQQHITKMLKTIYSPIELSYDNLESPELKSLFLFCAQFSYFINYQDLLKCTYGYGLFHGIDTLEEARNNLDTLLRQLKDSCLLLESSDGFHLHDLVRDVATIIASKDRNWFVMRDEGGLKAWPDEDSRKRCEAFSILGGDIDQLRNKMECPKLKFFYIHRNKDLEIPDTLFQGMDELKVLDLNEMRLSSLPSSLLLLRNLQALCLERCELEDISGIEELKNLVILSLRDSKISELPREVGSLVHLRMLDLSNCFNLKMIPPNVLSSLVELEELYMINGFVNWEADQGLNDEKEYVNLAELTHMSHLTTLEIRIPDGINLPKASMFKKLERYKIGMGDVWFLGWKFGPQFSRTLKLKQKKSFQLEVSIKMLLQRTEDLYLEDLNGVKSVIPKMDEEGFQQLKHLRIQSNNEIKHIVNLRTSIIAFPILEKFVVHSMTNLEEICCGKLSPASFQNLRVLEVEKCEKLRFVFSSSIAKELSLLEELKVTSCHKMVAIVVTEEEEDGIKDGDMILFCKLKTLLLKKLPKLVSFLSTKNSVMTEGNHDVHMTLLHHQVVAFPSLEILRIDGLPKIKHVWTECSETNCRFQNLKEISVRGCESLRSIFPTSATSCLQQLERLSIRDCGVEEIVSVEGGEAVATLQFPRVTDLQLTNSRRLKWFYKGVHISNWPMLKSMRIEGCEQIETLVSGIHVSSEETVGENIKQSLFQVDVHSFPSLEMLEIQSMSQLEIIWQDQDATSSFSNIQTLKISKCKKLLHVFQSNLLTTTSMQSLISLYVSSCDSLETIFGKLEGPNENETPESRTKKKIAKEDGATRHFVSTVASPSLEKGENLPKKNHERSEDPNTIFRFQNLQEIKVHNCKSLRSVFTSSVITCLKQLKTLEIKFCGVEEIVSVEGEGGEAVARFVFPRVTTLSLVNLRRLKWFYKGVHVSNWPMLVEMEIIECDKVEMIASGVVSFQETAKEKGSEMSIKQPLFLVDDDKHSFPSLKLLKIWLMSQLEIIWQDQVAKSSFSNIQTLRIYRCDKLLHVFQSNLLTTTSMQSLISLDVIFCDSLETIFGKLEGPNENETPESRTKKKIAKEDGATRHFVSTVASPSLEKGENLPKKNHEMSEDPNTIFRFQNLQKIKVHNCKSLRSVFTSSVITCLKQLKTLEIKFCGVEEIVSVEGEGGEAVARFVFPRVTTLSLVSLRRLKWFYKGVHVSNWPMLVEMEIIECDKVEMIASGVVSFQETAKEKGSEMSIKQPLFLVDDDKHSFPSLEMLEIQSMSQLEIIWQDQVATSSFSNIQTLKISNCKKLLHVFQSNLLTTTSMQSLISLNVASPSLEKGEDLPKKNHERSEDPNTIFRFQNLQEIKVHNCKSLRSVFTSSVITCLKQLKTVEIKFCGVEEIVSVEGEGGEAVARFVFPRVTKLTLEGLDRLKWFYKGVHVSNWPMLEEMKIAGCNKVEIIASGVVSFQERAEEKGSEMSIKQPLFLVDHDKLPFPSLKTLHIQKMDKLEMICQDQVALMSLISNLQILRITGCQQLRSPPIFQSNILTATFIQNLTELDLEYPQSLETISGKHEGQKGKETQGLQSALPNLEVLSLQFNIEAIWPSKFSDFPPSSLTRMPNLLELRIFSSGWEEIDVMIHTRLRRLLLNRLPMLTHLWKEDTQPCPLFHNLEFLNVLKCSKLKNLVPSSVSLQNLTGLRISNCHGLINLVASSTAKSLTQLREMSVTECKRITEIVAIEDGEADIAFLRLKRLELDGLPNLTNFCSGAYSYNFPSLEEVIVKCCPEMKTFCQYGVLKTPKLEVVERERYLGARHWKHDLNTATHLLWELDHYDTRWLFRQSFENSTTEEDEDP